MSRQALVVSIALALAATACQGNFHPGAYDPGEDPASAPDADPGEDPGTDPGGTPGGDPTAAARALFESTVAPTLEAKCTACHGGPGTSPL